MGSRKSNNQNKCAHFDRGYCKFGEKCKNKHPDKVCNNKDCFNENCDFRHPNSCKYGPRCKFYQRNVCLYSHEKLPCPCEENNIKFEELEKKILGIEKLNKTSKKESNQDIIKQVDKKFEVLENKIKDLTKTLDEKDLCINNLEKKLITLEESFKKENKEIGMKFIEINDKNGTFLNESIAE